MASGDSTYASGCVFSGGSAPISGGCIYGSGVIHVDRCSFIGNSAGSRGGAIYPNGAKVIVSATNCVFSKNNAPYYGGAVNFQRASGYFSNCIFSGNSGATNGGRAIAILNDGAYCKIEDCTFANNEDIYGNNSSTTLDITGTNTIYRVFGNCVVTISSGASINLTSSIEPGGGITVLTGGCTVNGNAIPAGAYTSINSNGQAT